MTHLCARDWSGIDGTLATMIFVIRRLTSQTDFYKEQSIISNIGAIIC